MSSREDDKDRLKRKLAPYQGFVHKVLARTKLSKVDAQRREGETLDAMLDRVVAAVDETIDAARATSAPAEKVKKVKKPKPPKPPKPPERPVVWNRADGRKYPRNIKDNYHPDHWTQQFPARAYPLKCGLEVWLPRAREYGIIVGFNERMRKYKVVMILKSVAQMPLDYTMLPSEIRTFSITSAIHHLKNPPPPRRYDEPAPVAAPSTEAPTTYESEEEGAN